MCFVGGLELLHVLKENRASIDFNLMCFSHCFQSFLIEPLWQSGQAHMVAGKTDYPVRKSDEQPQAFMLTAVYSEL